MVGVSQSTISRELRWNTGQRGYRHKQAQGKSDERRQAARKALKMTPEMIERVEDKLREHWSPEQISGWLLKEHDELLSHERIYLHIWADKCAGGLLYTHLRILHRHPAPFFKKRVHLVDRLGVAFE